MLIGINYFGTDAELGGCIADVKRMRCRIAAEARCMRTNETNDSTIDSIAWIIFLGLLRVYLLVESFV